MQLPALPDSAQDLQLPVQAVPQQTPCAQNPELHSALSPQVPPSGFLPQLFITHVLGAMQSASAVQVVRHWPLSPHLNGAHDCEAAPMQLPAPSHRPADVSDDPVQPDIWQTVPCE